MSSQKSDGIVKRRAPKPHSKPIEIEVADDFEGAYEDFTALVKSPRAQWVTAKALHTAIQHINASFKSLGVFGRHDQISFHAA